MLLIQQWSQLPKATGQSQNILGERRTFEGVLYSINWMLLMIFYVIKLRWIKEWICSRRPITICAIVRPGYVSGLESGLTVTSLGGKDQWGLSNHLQYRETCSIICPEHYFWAIRSSQLVQVDQLLSYPLVFIYLGIKLDRQLKYHLLVVYLIWQERGL